MSHVSSKEVSSVIVHLSLFITAAVDVFIHLQGWRVGGLAVGGAPPQTH